MRRKAGIAALLSGAVLLASCAQPGGQRGFRERNLRPVAQPGEVVAAELAFARAAQDKGQWTAFAEYAADDAVMFVPEPVKAKDWLKGRANPPEAVQWEPYRVWSSCDGTLAVSTGAYRQADGSFGRYVTVWQRQAKGGYKFVLDMGEPLDEPLAEPEMVQADVADCPGGGVRRPGAEAVFGLSGGLPGGRSADGSLTWRVEPADGANRLRVDLRKGGEMVPVLPGGAPS